MEVWWGRRDGEGVIQLLIMLTMYYSMNTIILSEGKEKIYPKKFHRFDYHDIQK